MAGDTGRSVSSLQVCLNSGVFADKDFEATLDLP